MGELLVLVAGCVLAFILGWMLRGAQRGDEFGADGCGTVKARRRLSTRH